MSGVLELDDLCGIDVVTMALTRTMLSEDVTLKEEETYHVGNGTV